MVLSVQTVPLMEQSAMGITDYNEIAAFVEVLKAGSFSAAAKKTGIPKSTLSRKVSQLEERLGVSLIQRTTRKIRLTGPGEQYYQSTARALEELESAEYLALQSQSHPQGLIRFTAPVEVGTAVMPQILKSFHEKYPDIEVEMILTDTVVNLIEENIDLALRAGAMEDSSLKARKIMSAQFMLYASRAYLKKHGTPKEPREIGEHKCLGFQVKPGPIVWSLSNSKTGARAQINIKTQLRANSLSAIRNLASLDMGIVLLPSFLCQEENELIPFLTDWSTGKRPSYLVYPAHKFMPPRLKLLMDHIQEMTKNISI
jgi:DNA-binding transcriptional LysR family regulator